MTDPNEPTYRRANAERCVSLRETEFGVETEISLAGGKVRFLSPSSTPLYNMLSYMGGSDSNTPFNIINDEQVILSVVFDKAYFDMYHITLESGSQSLTLTVDDEADREALLVGLERALASL